MPPRNEIIRTVVIKMKQRNTYIIKDTVIRNVKLNTYFPHSSAKQAIRLLIWIIPNNVPVIHYVIIHYVIITIT